MAHSGNRVGSEITVLASTNQLAPCPSPTTDAHGSSTDVATTTGVAIEIRLVFPADTHFCLYILPLL